MMRLPILVVLAGVLVGCGEAAVPGGRTSLSFLGKIDGTRQFVYSSNKDIVLKTLKVDPNTGEVNLEGLNSVGSTLGEMQKEWSIIESNNRRAVIGDLVGLLGTVAPLFGGQQFQGGGTVGGAGPNTLALARETVLARIAACPFMGDAEKARLSSLVPLASESMLNQILASLPTVGPATRPE